MSESLNITAKLTFVINYIGPMLFCLKKDLDLDTNFIWTAILNGDF